MKTKHIPQSKADIASLLSREARRKITEESNNRKRVATAGKSFYAPFTRGQNKDRLSEQENKYVYYCALAHEACLELNPKARRSFLEVLRVAGSESVRKYQGDVLAEIKNAPLNTVTELSDGQNIIKPLIESVKTYILEVFNHDKESPRIIPSSENSVYLTMAITSCALVECRNLTFEDLDRQIMGENYWVMQDQTDDIHNRPDRRRRKRLKEIAKAANCTHLIHENPLYGLAKLWYFAYVIKDNLTVASQLGKYQYSDGTPEIEIPSFAFPGTAYNKIHAFSLATGYSEQ
jgi:hypothetical protein